MFDFDAVVVGAGAVGLACAARLAEAGCSMVVLEAASHVGMGISSRNSEVIHAGLYYPTGSLKHRLCLRGRELLYGFLERRGLPFLKCGKIVVANTPDELTGIEALLERGCANGVAGLEMVSAARVSGMEPEVTSVGGLLSAETGVFDSHQYLVSLRAQIEEHEGHVALRTPFKRAEPVAGGFRIRTGGQEPAILTARLLVNSAGLAAPAVAAAIEGQTSATIPTYRLAKGSYFRLAKGAPFSRLVYPAPVDGGLGVHATIDIAGQTRFGPDVEWLPEGMLVTDVDYKVDSARAQQFYAAVRRYWPGLPDGALVADYSGCRPKLSGPGMAPADFQIQTAQVHGASGLINLFGIESPGLTSSLAIAERVESLLR